MRKKSVGIIGGGITGLSAAWYLQQLAPDVRLHLIEPEPYWGGKLVSHTLALPEGNLVIEGGPESFVTRKPELVELVRQLGLSHQLVAAPSQASKMRILFDGKPQRAPLSPAAFISTPLLSARGKLRMLAEPFIPPRRTPGDESLAQFVDRRLGREARERFIGPVLAGIYNTDPETQSLLTTAPVMRELEQHGSLVRGALVRQFQRRNGPAAARLPQFVTFTAGTQALADALVQRLGADLRLGQRVTAVTPDMQLSLSTGEALSVDALLITTGANVAANLLGRVAPLAAAELAAIRHNHIGTLSLVYRTASLPPGLDISGLMIPRREQRPIDAITCVRAPLNPRVPPGYSLLKVFFGGGQLATAELDDSALTALVRRELHHLLGIQAEPLAVRAYRWLDSFPQADVGHLERITEIETMLPPGIFLAGAAYRGLGVPDCIRQAQAAARQVIAHLAVIPNFRGES